MKKCVETKLAVTKETGFIISGKMSEHHFLSLYRNLSGI